MLGSGATWVEVGDAGEDFVNFQTITGSGVVDLITGTLDGDVDTYLINIDNPSIFYATTSPVDGNFTGNASDDVQLMLFTDTGVPVLRNDDSPTDGSNFQPFLSDPGIFPGTVDPSAFATPLTAGNYILAVAQWQSNVTGTGPMFEPASGFASLHGPAAGAGNATAFSGGGGPTTYNIELAGVSVVGVPEPSSALLGGLAALALLRRRRK